MTAMQTLDELLDALKEPGERIEDARFGVLAESSTEQLTVLAKNGDVAVGDLFLLPSRRGAERVYVFRTTKYANVLNRQIEMGDVARNKLTMPDSYLAEDLAEEQLIELNGIILGYAELESTTGTWGFHRPRRLPQHLSDVYRVDPRRPQVAGVVRTLLQSQLGDGGLYVGDLLAGEQPLRGVPVYLPPYALSHHLGVFGRTGSGKSNLMMVLLRSALEYNAQVSQAAEDGPRVSILAIDPHDEFRTWHAASGGADGLRGIVDRYTGDQRRDLVNPFYYLTARDVPSESPGSDLERRLHLSRADIVPSDLVSVIEFSEQQVAFAGQAYGEYGDRWISRLLLGETDLGMEGERGTDFLPGTIAAVQRRLGFLRHGQTRVFTRFDRELGHRYLSLLPDIICQLERGRMLIVDTTLMSELEQFLLTTIVARVLFQLRKALRTTQSADRLDEAIRQALGNDDEQGLVGQRELADELVLRLQHAELPYRDGKGVRPIEQLPYVNVVVEEAPSVLNPDRLRFGSVFPDISRQGRKFGIGLTVVSQQVSAIDNGILTQVNTELTMALGNEVERREAIRNASADLHGFERELQVLGKGQAILSASYRDVPLPIQAPDYDALSEVQDGW